MPCPTCDHTLHRLGEIEGRAHYHCPRCGTHRVRRYRPDDANRVEPIYDDTIPSLVDRCRKFGDLHIPKTSGYRELWERAGIAEAIDLPGDR